MQLVIGNKNYSSWSLRPWLGLKVARIPFEEKLVVLRQPETQEALRRFSPAGKVPVLLDGDATIWDSLAIAEYLAERFPEKRFWPDDVKARALARSICAEMHSGFGALRTECSMDVRSRKSVVSTPELQKDIDRVVAIWTDTIERFGGETGFLFDRFTWADAFFAPVVSRFITYGIETPPRARRYMEQISSLPAMKEWVAAAEQEPWVHA